MTVLGRFLFILLFASSFPVPKLVIQGLVLTVFTHYSSLSSPPTPKGEGDSVNSPSSDIIENLYLADPDAIVSFQAGLYHYQLSFKGTHFKGSHLQLRSALQRLTCKLSQLLGAMTSFTDTTRFTDWKGKRGSDGPEEIPYKSNLPPYSLTLCRCTLDQKWKDS